MGVQGDNAMKDLCADEAINIINELRTEVLDYYSEYLPLINAALTLKAYEEESLAVNDLKILEGNSLCSICQNCGESDARTYAHWIDHGSDIECSNCGFTCDDEYYLGNKVACPNCAAIMRKEVQND